MQKVLKKCLSELPQTSPSSNSSSSSSSSSAAEPEPHAGDAFKFKERILQGGGSPLSQELLNSVRRAESELRRTTGSEPKKLMDVAEYRSFPVQQEQDVRENSWRSIIHYEFKQSLIYVPTMTSTRVFFKGSLVHIHTRIHTLCGTFITLQISAAEREFALD